MNETVENEQALDVQSLDLGQWMGRREAFGLIAGRCSAADIEIIRRIKEDKLYARMDCTWDEFCTRHLHVARRTVDKEIGLLHQFGPAFFTIRQLTHVRIKDYEAIAPHVNEQGVTVDGKVVALLPENSQPLAAAVDELLQRDALKKRAANPVPFDALFKRCEATGRALRAFQEKLSAKQKDLLLGQLIEIRNAGEALGARFVDVTLGLKR